MKELYLAMAILCFLVAVMIYCVNKSIQALKELHNTWKDYKRAQEEILNYFKEKR